MAFPRKSKTKDIYFCVGRPHNHF